MPTYNRDYFVDPTHFVEDCQCAASDVKVLLRAHLECHDGGLPKDELENFTEIVMGAIDRLMTQQEEAASKLVREEALRSASANEAI